MVFQVLDKYSQQFPSQAHVIANFKTSFDAKYTLNLTQALELIINGNPILLIQSSNQGTSWV